MCNDNILNISWLYYSILIMINIHLKVSENIKVGAYLSLTIRNQLLYMYWLHWTHTRAAQLIEINPNSKYALGQLSNCKSCNFILITYALFFFVFFCMWCTFKNEDIKKNHERSIVFFTFFMMIYLFLFYCCILQSDNNNKKNNFTLLLLCCYCYN